MEEETPHVTAEIEINATPEEVWNVMFNYDKLGEWSNFFLGTKEPMKKGEMSTAYFKNPITGGKIEATHEVIAFEPNRRFGWSGEVAAGRHDHHIYEFEPTDNGTTIFRQTDGFYGKPSNVLVRLFEHGLEGGYKSFNTKLKERVESLKASENT